MLFCPSSLPSSCSALRGQPLQQQRSGHVGAVGGRVPASLRVPRATLEADRPAGPADSGAAVPDASKAGLGPRINLIPQSAWEDGIPPVMGAHLMASGIVSPLSTSKGVGRAPDAFKFYYPSAQPDTAVLQFVNKQAVTEGVAQLVADASAKAVAQRGTFTIALSGGSLVESLSALAGRSDVAFSKWHVFWVDERNVPLDSPDSNYAAAADAFLDRAGVPAAQVHSIKPGLSVAEAATNYAGRMLDLGTDVLPRNDAGLPVLDVVLLGLGPDGHVASLFPNGAALADDSGAWVLPVANSPKPPAQRITLSLPVINAASQIVFVAVGAGKAEVVQRVLEVQALPGALPAQMVKPTGGSVTWVLDEEATRDLQVDAWQNAKAYPRSQLGDKK